MGQAVRQFPRPPRSFEDARERRIDIGVGGSVAELTEMYAAYTDADRAQGIPPRERGQIESWVEGLLAEGANVVARHGDRAVGHAALLPHDETAELVIFVHPDYHHAGIGTRLIETLLGLGQREGLSHVWLSVEGDNQVAMNLYRKVGFETRARHRGEHEMERRLAVEDGEDDETTNDDTGDGETAPETA